MIDAAASAHRLLPTAVCAITRLRLTQIHKCVKLLTREMDFPRLFGQMRWLAMKRFLLTIAWMLLGQFAVAGDAANSPALPFSGAQVPKSGAMPRKRRAGMQRRCQ